MEINGKDVQVLYAVCYDPHNSFDRSKLIIEKVFDNFAAAKEWKVGDGYKIYVRASIVDQFGFVRIYWGKSIQQALSRLRKAEKF